MDLHLQHSAYCYKILAACIIKENKNKKIQKNNN